MKLKIFASICLAAVFLTACNYHSTNENPADSAASGSNQTYEVAAGNSDDSSFSEIVNYMKSSEAVTTWFEETESFDGFTGECWYDIPELQKVCDVEVELEPNIINYTSFHIYYSSKDQIEGEVTYFEIFELEEGSDYYNKVKEDGEITFKMKVPYRNTDGLDKDQYLADFHNMTTAERLLYTYDASGNVVTLDDTIDVTLPIHGLNGRFVIVVHSGINPEGEIIEAFSSENERAHGIVDAFTAFGS
jgi:hypothetical protein